MKIFIGGADGFLGFSLSQYLASRGHEIMMADNFSRRLNVEEMKSHSITPIVGMESRLRSFQRKYGQHPKFYFMDVRDNEALTRILKDFKPDAVVQMAENPSAPHSMIDYEHARNVIDNNLLGTLSILYAMKEACPEAHLAKVCTMGVWGTPNTDIPEGFFGKEDMFRGRSLEGMEFPKCPGSYYHSTKVMGATLISLANRHWGVRATDVAQGVVYGTRIPEMGYDDPALLTRFDVDECFGTAINRFCAQAVIGEPITPFGAGHQKRGFLPLKDSVQCFTLLIENPPEGYRMVNQLEEVYDITQLANKVSTIAKEYGLLGEVRNIENPRKENENHYYNPDHKKLLDLGYKPTTDMDAELRIMFADLIKYKDRIIEVKETITPKIRWSGEKKECKLL